MFFMGFVGTSRSQDSTQKRERDEASRPLVLFLISEDEYESDKTLVAFASEHLEPLGFRSEFATTSKKKPMQFDGLDALEHADLLVVSVRRRAPIKEQLERIQTYCRSGKPVVGIRTASHAFSVSADSIAEGCAAWPEFDAEILGGNYQGHHGNRGEGAPKSFVWREESKLSHPILSGIEAGETHVTSWLYKTTPLKPTTTVLFSGRVEGREPSEPVAWTNVLLVESKLANGKSVSREQRVFYTSLGHPDEFKLAMFQKLLTNGIVWALEKETKK
jgi:type 1 glutamine amidotransferase